ncbi:hypothetical protein GGS23DRAFT_150359 [Durotheca rogersii]|uniref:uncharacterized protein n=1 Tax=Durotheca rogersii TaxID=419775 RepID=UPI0022204AA2|nr:uncharacterized protein GGS23DRAFT_150359 [Durotheca rogersii]KAI5861421.1 hypothetical protein GGS23DRAFT_150359 [Durotheca rogersii]
MAALGPKNSNVQLLSCLIDEEDTGDSEYRFLVDRQTVKYVTTAPGVFCGAEDDRTFGPILLSELLPPFPTGNWNKGYVAKDPQTGQTAFIRTETVRLSGVESLWHPTKLDVLEFTQKEWLRQRVHVSTHPELGGDGAPVLVKLAVWPWEVPFMETETAIYRQIDGKGIGPRFLGHLTEGRDGRVVGFAVEWVEGARAAGPGDLGRCREALRRLHELGIKSGDTNKHNFLVRHGHDDVVLVDFELAKQNCSPQELEAEMATLESSLADVSFRGGVKPIRE